jgi:ADP-heptose:LPS heptosyltransferase
MKLAQLTPLARPGIQFHSLQKGDRAAEAPPAGMNWNDHSAQFADFADTAAYIASLDLVISVDTAVAHLAAAMGKPVWLLLPYLPDWRWLTERDDSPWYPTMRLFRQPTAGDWATPIRRVAEALRR